MILLGRTASNVGIHSGYLAGGPNYSVRYRRFTHPRLLYHSGLNQVLQYPQVPTRTLNFSLGLLPKVDWVQSKTLTSNLTQQWNAVEKDIIIKEMFEGTITQRWSFMHAIYNMWTTILDTDEYCLWRPFDLTDKSYRVNIVNCLIGGEEFDPTGVGINQPDKWMTATFEIWLKLASAVAPSVVVFGSGGLGV